MRQNPIERHFVNTYQETWETRSSIRTRPRKYIDFKENGYFFPEKKQPLLLNQEIVNLGEKIKEEILLQTFYKYLNDIINLEIKLINSACTRVIYSDLVVKYPEAIKLNACTIIIDEYYHVYVAKDMLLQLDQHYPDLKKVDYPVSDAYHAVTLIKGQLDKKYHEIFEIIAVCIFETTLVRELVEFFNSDDIHPSIRYYINDHMNDESKHYGFFFDLLSYTWQKMPDDYKKSIGEHFSDFIKLYLNINSEKKFNKDLLNDILKDEKKSISIVEDIYKGFDITPDIPIVKNVFNVLKKSSLDKDKYIKESFKKIEWNL
ncbi:hypothetical protein ID47_00935 [Candidatus Paracaedibacter acanthamoebae]|uniref:Aminobenzoate oxygenase n=1 Tax=Candidatus Odyssella acanthamoebae TaxID=91604 RepID=A0A077AVE9_9PROT|nr:hypothetical protein ID47_00935 [Candidatus Paracaedibacter acanthamoebae]